jgi:hypothetical protein
MNNWACILQQNMTHETYTFKAKAMWALSTALDSVPGNTGIEKECDKQTRDVH